jgi:ADP-ribose pyrophosphatase YjhB (NUDIX family)
MMKADELVMLAKRIESIASIGLLYSNDEYNKDRYTELREISMQLFSMLSGESVPAVQNFFLNNKDYPTAKVDIRGLLVDSDKRVLFVKEQADNKWSLPGGWADVGYSASEVIIKEFREETGLEVTPLRLLAVFDKKMHPHPPQPSYVYKMVFHCQALSATLAKGFDVNDVAWFPIDELPPLSEDRILKSQIELLYNMVLNNIQPAYFD